MDTNGGSRGTTPEDVARELLRGSYQAASIQAGAVIVQITALAWTPRRERKRTPRRERSRAREAARSRHQPGGGAEVQLAARARGGPRHYRSSEGRQAPFCEEKLAAASKVRSMLSRRNAQAWAARPGWHD
jgi:hypothetical protein